MTVQEYLNLNINSLNEIPTTKRALYRMIKCFIDAKRPGAIAVSGLRKAGKTTLLKQLALDIGGSLYVSFEYLRNNQELGWDVVEYIKERICSGELSVLLLDEVTKPFAYDDILKELVRLSADKSVPVVFTSSSRYYLKQITIGTLGGGRCVYTELRPLTFFEYMSEFRNIQIGDWYELAGVASILECCQRLSDFGCTEELFYEYLEFLVKAEFTGGTENYIQSSYEDLLTSDQGLSVYKFKCSDDYDIKLTTAYLRVSQFKLTGSFSNVQSFCETISRYKRECEKIKRSRGIRLSKLVEGITTQLIEDVEMLKGKSDRVEESLRVLASAGLVVPLYECNGILDNSYNKQAADFYKGWVGHPYTGEYLASDINIYLCLLFEFLKATGLEGNVVEYVTGLIKGDLVEYYVASQVIALGDKKYALRLELNDLTSAREIDVCSEELGVLVEVGMKKNSGNLAFCDSEFEKLYPNLKSMKRICAVGSSAVIFTDSYYKIPYYVFGAFIDMCILRKQAESIRVYGTWIDGKSVSVESAERELDTLLEEYNRIASE